MRVIPLGGLGEVGLNAMVFESGGESLLVDCGLMFPNGTVPGVDLIVPDFTYLLASRERLKAVVLTHAHEDHLGALPFLLRELPDLPVYGTPFSLALLRHRLDEQGLAAELRELAPRHPFTVGTQLTVEPIHVAHSVPGAVGLAVSGAHGTFIHSGDFKLDDTPIDGKPTDLDRFGELGERGVTCLLSDSTNAEVEGTTGSEALVARTFERLFNEAKGRRIVVALFSSHLHRIQEVLDLAARTGRRVAFNGRSMLRNVRLAQESGVLRVPDGVVIDVASHAEVLPERLVVVTSGAQAEPRAGLMQMLSQGPMNDGREYRPLRLDAGDLVILSSRIIPGNEREVSEMLNRIVATGAEAIYPAVERHVHVSGHASRDEQRKLIQTVRPKAFVPIHGELRHLHWHRELARETAGLGDEQLLLARDGDVLDFSGTTPRRSGQVPFGRVMLDRASGLSAEPGALSERGQLAEGGLVLVALLVDRTSRALVRPPVLELRGLPSQASAVASSAADEARAAFEAISEAVRADEAHLREEVARAVRRLFRQRLGLNPVVVPFLIKL